MGKNKIGWDIKPADKVCYNCKHLAWMIGIGQGLRCSNPTKEKKPEVIPSSKHFCELFEFKSIVE